MAGANYYLPPLDRELKKVRSIELCAMDKATMQTFSVTQNKDAIRRGVCETIPVKNGIPLLNGTSDPRLGSFSPFVICETCTQKYPMCPGHFGHIELAEPMFNLCYFRVVTLLLKTICKSCGQSLIDTTHPDYPSANAISITRFRLRALSQICRTTCQTTKSTRPYTTDPHHENENDDNEDNDHPLGCNMKQPRLRRTEGTLLFDLLTEHGTSTEITQWTAHDVLRLFEKVNPAHWAFLGFSPSRFRNLREEQSHTKTQNTKPQKPNPQHAPTSTSHPCDLLLEIFPVPPLHLRPSVAFNSATAALPSEDDLTHILLAIIRLNKDLSHKLESGLQHEIAATRAALQLNLSCYVNNTTTLFRKQKVTSRQGRALKSVAERLKGKYGRVRQHLMGKRVEFCARTVITGDPNVEVDEVGVPRSVAMTVSFPERVTGYNREGLTELVRRGPHRYPGANFVLQANGERLGLKEMNPERLNKVVLTVGSIVERHMRDGDVVLFNRQPTLHRMSMMGHRARVLPFNTFRLNLSTTTPYNADFDGDEMNLHLPQSLLTKGELMEFMMVPRNFISPGKAYPVMGIVQDSLAGVYLLTRRNTFLDKFTFQSMCMWVEGWSSLVCPAIVKPKPLWTGKQAFTMALPKVSLETHEKDGNDVPDTTAHGALMAPRDLSVLIRHGELLHGVVVKKIVGNLLNSLIHVIVNLEGTDACKDFMNAVQRITAYFLIHHSFSVGIKDSVPTEASVRDVDHLLRETEGKVRKICQNALDNTFSDKRGKTLLEAFETEVNTVLSQCRTEAGKKIVDGYRDNNGFKCMYKAGSKGNEMNISQIGAIVGQQNCEGKRIQFGFRRRTLPHFVRDDYGPQSKGYIKNSYIRGLTAPDFFFHAMAGREGLIDTACKTADTGYIQRRIIKMCEDLTVGYDGTVRNAANRVLQFTYGEDGLDGPKVEVKQDLPFVTWGNARFAEVYRYEIADDGTVLPRFGGEYLSPGVRKYFRDNPAEYRTLMTEYDSVKQQRESFRALFRNTRKENFGLAVHFPRLIQLAQERFDVGKRPSQRSALNPLHVIQAIGEVLNTVERFLPTRNRGRHNKWTRLRLDTALCTFRMALYGYLNSRRVIKEYRLDQKAFDWLCGEICSRYQQALVHPGEMVGAIAAQSCGEPATQMTLNTFHFAGVASKNVTLGVPRLKELINCTRNPKVSNMSIFLTPEFAGTKEGALHALAQIEHKTLYDLVQTVEIHYDPDPAETVVEADHDFVARWWDLEFHPPERQAEMVRIREHASRFVMRLLLDPTTMHLMRLSPEEMGEALRAVEDKWHYEASDPNAAVPVLRIRLEDESDLHKQAEQAYEAGEPFHVQDTVELYRKTFPELLRRVRLSGVPGVTKSFITEREKYFVLDPHSGEYVEKKEFFVETEGSNLLQVLGLPIVDATRTLTNHITEVFQVLGIEAVMQVLCKEMLAVYEKYGVDVNHRHFLMLAEIMTGRGHLTPLTRQGMAKTDSGPLMRATYEQQLEVLMEGAAHGEVDEIAGVSSNIMLGQPIKGGTGAFDVLLHEGVIQSGTTQEQAVRARGVEGVYHSPGAYSGFTSTAREGSSASGDVSHPTPFLDQPIARGMPPGSASEWGMGDAAGNTRQASQSLRSGSSQSAMGHGHSSVLSLPVPGLVSPALSAGGFGLVSPALSSGLVSSTGSSATPMAQTSAYGLNLGYGAAGSRAGSVGLMSETGVENFPPPPSGVSSGEGDTRSVSSVPSSSYVPPMLSSTGANSSVASSPMPTATARGVMPTPGVFQRAEKGDKRTAPVPSVWATPTGPVPSPSSSKISSEREESLEGSTGFTTLSTHSSAFRDASGLRSSVSNLRSSSHATDSSSSSAPRAAAGMELRTYQPSSGISDSSRNSPSTDRFSETAPFFGAPDSPRSHGDSKNPEPSFLSFSRTEEGDETGDNKKGTSLSNLQSITDGVEGVLSMLYTPTTTEGETTGLPSSSHGLSPLYDPFQSLQQKATRETGTQPSTSFSHLPSDTELTPSVVERVEEGETERSPSLGLSSTRATSSYAPYEPYEANRVVEAYEGRGAEEKETKNSNHAGGKGKKKYTRVKVVQSSMSREGSKSARSREGGVKGSGCEGKEFSVL